jgi:SAM-dependent MidA family methyltransferase
LTTELGILLAERIAADGPITFAEFMDQALYHPQFGYYTAGPERSGWGGDFITAPQLDPAFGELWGRALQNLWVDAGRPPRFDLIEVGPGEGGFACGLIENIDADFAEVLHLSLVERAPGLRTRQQERLVAAPNVRWFKDLSEVPVMRFGCVFANEILDNQPVHLIEGAEGSTVELMVSVDGDALALEAGPPTPAATDFMTKHGIEPALGRRLEISPAAQKLVKDLATRVEQGAVVFVDYGGTAEQLADRPEGTLISYSTAGADSDPLARVGQKDLTVFANWTVVMRTLEASGLSTAGPLTQTAVLRSLGAADLDRRLRDEHIRACEEKRGRDALRAISRRQALGALLDEGGLGGLEVVCGLRGMPDSTFPLGADERGPG